MNRCPKIEHSPARRHDRMARHRQRRHLQPETGALAMSSRPIRSLHRALARYQAGDARLQPTRLHRHRRQQGQRHPVRFHDRHRDPGTPGRSTRSPRSIRMVAEIHSNGRSQPARAVLVPRSSTSAPDGLSDCAPSINDIDRPIETDPRDRREARPCPRPQCSSVRKRHRERPPRSPGLFAALRARPKSRAASWMRQSSVEPAADLQRVLRR